MKSPFQLPALTKVVQRPLKTASIITGAITVISVSGLFFLQPQIPIFYSLPLMSQQLADRIWILTFPGLSLAITLIHTLLVGIYRQVDEEVLRLFSWLTLVLQLLLLAILVRLMILIV